MTTLSKEKNIPEIFAKMSKWGLTIEAGGDSAECFAALKECSKRLPDDFKKAVCLAKMMQGEYIRMHPEPFSDDSPIDHPGRRLARIKEYLEPLVS